jgi:hypothetical protein
MTNTFTIDRIDVPGEALRYQDAEGPIRIVCVDAGDEYPVVGVHADGSVDLYTQTGSYNLKAAFPEFDLTPIPAPKPAPHTFYVNVYEGSIGAIRKTKKSADDLDTTNERLYCIKVQEVERYED